MMKRILLLLFTISQFSNVAQTTISGKVIDSKNRPVAGASIYLDGTYDGSSSNDNGEYEFTTEEEGLQTLVISFISYETFIKTANVASFKNSTIKLRDDVNTLDAVVINAGTFEAGDNAKVTALKPLDVVTTASAMGDFVGALQTLPGTSTVAEDGRLFVRGGEADETQIFVDGIRVFTPFTPTPNNVPTRGRYSPFLFKGITFSTGGYSAEYGQALSSILLLNTIDEPDQEKTELSFLTVGLGVGNTQKWGRNSLSINTSYINLAPYLEITPSRNEWIKPYQSMSGETVYRHQFKDDSFLKLYGAYSYTELDVVQEDINFDDGVRFGLQNRNLYFNTSYKTKFGNRWKIATGASFTNDNANIKLANNKIDSNDNSAHFKVKLHKRFSSRFRLSMGSEYFVTHFKERFSPINNTKFNYGFNNNIFASFVETDLFFSKNLATKIGIRAEKTGLLNEFTLSPRAAISYKSGKNAQFSFAYGKFFQNPRAEYLKFHEDFSSENTSHFIANYQSVKQNQIFRIEGYYKAYNNLVKFDTQVPNFTSNFNNNGSGFAKGIDVFWRQNQKIKNTDYWVSYSYLETERDYRNFPVAATPNFAPKHNFSFVAKHWVASWKSQLGLSYAFASGRNFTNPNKPGFLNDKTKTFNSLSLNCAYLIDQQKILFFAVSNALGTKNIFGYNYRNTPNGNGFFDRQARTPDADRFFVIGFFWTISSDKKSNQLNNL